MGLMKIFRRILFYIFFSAYLVLCPLIVFYAFGYIFTPKVEEGFVKTGLVHVETLPGNASLSIANRRYSQKTPATIRNLLAGKYAVKLSLKGYRPWVREVTIAAGKAVNFEKVLLLPEKMKSRVLFPGPFESIQAVPGTHFLILKGGRGAGDLKTFDWRSQTLRSFLPEGSSLARSEVARIFTARESSFVVVQLKGPEGVKFLGCPVDREKPEAKDLTDLFAGAQPSELFWEGNRPEYVFALSGKTLSRLDLGKMAVSPVVLDEVRGMGLLRGKVYALRGTSIVRMNFNAKPGDMTLVERGVFLQNLFGGEEPFRIDFISSDAICFLGEKGQLFSNILPYRFVDKGVRGYQPDAAGKKIVLWQEERIGLLDLEKPERKDVFFERGPEISWAYERGEDLRQAYFVLGDAYALFLDKGQVFLMRLGDDQARPEKIVSARADGGIFYTERTGKLYYLNPDQGELVMTDIIPEEVTFSGVIGEMEPSPQEVRV